jgi:Na+/H+ antiporter
MALFESVLLLMMMAIILLQVSRRLTIPYPTMLAMAGVGVAALPWAPDIRIDPQLVMALFIAPALLDAAYDFPLRAIRRYWLALLTLAVMAVLLTTAAVAWVGVALGGLPVAAAIALGAIVSPPDAAAATAMLRRLPLPRATVTVLKGESLLNDAVALLIFSAAVGVAAGTQSPSQLLPQLALAVPGGIVVGIVLGRISTVVLPHLSGTLGGILFQFTMTFGTWLIAEYLQLSAILAVVAAAMTVARHGPNRPPARDRVFSFTVWSTVVFLLNVLAFLLVGLEARVAVLALGREQLWHALSFAAVVVFVVIGVRMVWVMLGNRMAQPIFRLQGRSDAPSLAQGVVSAWCGMRGLVTLATALALPQEFPGRDLILLSALAVVLGTLIVQGITLGPLIRMLRFAADNSLVEELASARVVLLDLAIEGLSQRDDEPARSLRDRYLTERSQAAGGGRRTATAADDLHRQCIDTQRRKLFELWTAGEIDDDVFHSLELELDLQELASSPTDRFELIEE